MGAVAEPLVLVYTAVSGPIEPVSSNGNYCVIKSIDRCTRLKTVYFLRRKATRWGLLSATNAWWSHPGTDSSGSVQIVAANAEETGFAIIAVKQ